MRAVLFLLSLYLSLSSRKFSSHPEDGIRVLIRHSSDIANVSASYTLLSTHRDLRSLPSDILLIARVTSITLLYLYCCSGILQRDQRRHPPCIETHESLNETKRETVWLTLFAHTDQWIILHVSHVSHWSWIYSIHCTIYSLTSLTN